VKRFSTAGDWSDACRGEKKGAVLPAPLSALTMREEKPAIF
jgi:hypothetical protein